MKLRQRRARFVRNQRALRWTLRRQWEFFGVSWKRVKQDIQTDSEFERWMFGPRNMTPAQEKDAEDYFSQISKNIECVAFGSPEWMREQLLDEYRTGLDGVA